MLTVLNRRLRLLAVSLVTATIASLATSTSVIATTHARDSLQAQRAAAAADLSALKNTQKTIVTDTKATPAANTTPAVQALPVSKPAQQASVAAPSVRTSGTVLKTGIQTQVSMPSPITGKIRNLLVPEETVLSIKLDKEFSSQANQLGDVVMATVVDNVYLGPYLAIPEGSRIRGAIVDINAKRDKDGRNPYLILGFNALQRPNDANPLPFSAELVAYKTGLSGQEYIWRLPEKGDRKKASTKGVIGGAITGALINPIFGAPIGAGLGLLNAKVKDHKTRGGAIHLKANKPLPIAVDQAFTVPIVKPDRPLAALPIQPDMTDVLVVPPEETKEN